MGESPHQSPILVFSAWLTSCHPPTLMLATTSFRQCTLPIRLQVLIERQQRVMSEALSQTAQLAIAIPGCIVF